MKGFMCGPRVYRYKDVLFEIHSFHGPCMLNDDGTPKTRSQWLKSFIKMVDEFEKLPDKEEYRVW